MATQKDDEKKKIEKVRECVCVHDPELKPRTEITKAKKDKSNDELIKSM